jgi:thiamine biosynthesis lipoprotein
MGLTDRSLVTVVARNGLTADALSTTISVLGPERGLALAAEAKAGVRIMHRPHQQIETHQSRHFARWRER